MRCWSICNQIRSAQSWFQTICDSYKIIAFEENKRKRLEWALKYHNWTYAQWASIFWIDEIWVTEKRHIRVWVTRRKEKELDSTCVKEKVQRRIEWMLWEEFNNITKDSCLFWEKEWDSINQIIYSKRIVSLIHEWLRLNSNLHLMQNHTSDHNEKWTLKKLRKREIVLIDWLSYSSDLNSIETIWNKMKDYIATIFSEKIIYNQSRAAIYETWESITPDFLRDLLIEMNSRCEAVIDAQSEYTRY